MSDFSSFLDARRTAMEAGDLQGALSIVDSQTSFDRAKKLYHCADIYMDFAMYAEAKRALSGAFAAIPDADSHASNRRFIYSLLLVDLLMAEQEYYLGMSFINVLGSRYDDVGELYDRDQLSIRAAYCMVMTDQYDPALSVLQKLPAEIHLLHPIYISLSELLNCAASRKKPV